MHKILNFVTDCFVEDKETILEFLLKIPHNQYSVYFDITHTEFMYEYFDKYIKHLYLYAADIEKEKYKIDDFLAECLEHKEIIDFFIPDIDILERFIFYGNNNISEEKLQVMYSKRYNLIDYAEVIKTECY